MKKKALLTLFAVWLLCVGTAFAVEVGARADIEPQTCAIGDYLIYSITVTAPSEVKVFAPAAFDQGPFSLLKRLPEEVTANGDISHTVFSYRLAAYGIGRLTLPAQQVGYYRPGEQILNVSTNEVTVEVQSMMPAGATTPEDLPPPDPVIAPQAIETVNWMLLVALAIMFVTALGVWLLFRYSRRLKPAVATINGEPPDPRSPVQRAEERLTEIELQKLLEKGQIKEHFSGTSEVMKAYFGEQNGFDSMEMTTYELLSELRKRKVAAQNLEGPRELLSQCDLVKFAKYQPSINEANGLISWARQLIRDHQPPEPAIVPTAENTVVDKNGEKEK